MSRLRLSPQMLSCFSLAAVLLTASGCYNVPVTGRKAVAMVDEQDVKEKSLVEWEQMKRMHRLSRNQAQIRVVQQIGSRLSQTVFWDVPLADWEFVVFESPNMINAFALPGGKVGVFSGLIDFCENEDQLASVIAHEIAHVAAKHTHERFSQNMLLSPLNAATNVGVGIGIGGVGVSMPSVGRAAGSGVQSVTQAAFDRGKELEADEIGLNYMARAGYDPREALNLLIRMEENLAAQGVKGPPGWLANHPGFPERQIRINELLPAAIKIYESGGDSTTPIIIQ
ncbi:M48 family metallopeptidase [Actomonas aquatica]|uniref:M48 family metallopeptidase n=1 Tax=Actomonas aquatica TaxID=2866162 RepID=A0ABZ1C5R5_9BACT|nr:M48 family metallopeptidase [Opitutus sp. WL0086]WRQ86703.1 M48 family metallopeptidase [Opitutus sp. WL0086]